MAKSLSVILLLLFFVNAHAVQNKVYKKKRKYTTPTIKVHVSEHPNFEDDLDFQNMETVLDRQIKRYKRRNLSGSISVGGKLISQKKLLNSLVEFKIEVKKYKQCLATNLRKGDCLRILNGSIQEKFNVYKPELTDEDPRQGDKNFTKFTAYYTPTLKGSNTPSSINQHAIYKLPSDQDLAQSTRRQIDFRGALKNENLELFYTSDLFELYNMQVEGGGRVLLPSGKAYYLSYSGTNKQRWNFISKYMLKQGMIKNGSIAAQKEFLKLHPELHEEIYSTCPSYVYFEVSPTQPKGSDLVPLTNNRSIATDYRHYRLKGMLAFVISKRLNPDSQKVRFKKFSRFMVDQDTGGAIKGKARVDLYFGEDDYAARAAQHQNHLGQLYFLVLK